MVYQRIQKSSSWNILSQGKSTPFAPRPFAGQVQQDSHRPPTQEEIENEAFNQHKFESFGLQRKKESGTITPVEQEQLGVLQAKMDDFWVQRLARTSRFDRNFANSPVHAPERQESALPTTPHRYPMPPLQAKLTIAQPQDRYEQEADRVAAQVVNQINAPQSSQQGETIERQEVHEEDEDDDKLQMKPVLQNPSSGIPASPELEAAIKQSRNSGHPLAASIRKPMEQALGVDFSQVKAHTDARADRLNRSIQAEAFTTGQDIFFRQGVYSPGNSSGQQLIAHELTHVMQQNRETVVQSSQGAKPLNKTSPSIGAAVLQRTTGTLTKKASTIEVGTRVRVIQNLGLRFRVEVIETGKTFWITGELKDFFQADPSQEDISITPIVDAEAVKKGVSSKMLGGEEAKKVVGTVAVLKKMPPPEKVVEDIIPESTPSSKSVASQEQQSDSKVKSSQKGTPGLLERLESRNFPSMGRVDDPSWEIIEPLLDEYGRFTNEEKEKMKRRFESSQKSGQKIRGIPDLIDRTFRGKRLEETVKTVKEGLSAAAPDLEAWKATGKETITCGRADTRPPHEIEDNGGFYGWDAGIVTGPHARRMIKTIMTMTVEEQKVWIKEWKYPTPDKSEANPWVASGISSPGVLGGQKGGGEFVYELPLIYLESGESEMIVATDTGNLENASVIGVRLGKNDKEIVMLTGIPWKYITHWFGSIKGQPPKLYEAKEAADETRKLV